MNRLEMESPLYAEIECIVYKFLQRKLNFDPWHSMSTIYSREYAKWIVQVLNQKIKKQKGECCVVEVGCGLAEILRNLDSKVRFGFDLDKKVLSAAKILSLGRENIKYQEGTFEDVNINMPIDYFICVL